MLQASKRGGVLGAERRDDGDIIRKVLELLDENEGMSERSAILKVIPPDKDEEAVLRRIQRKLKAYREGCPSMILSRVKPVTLPKEDVFGRVTVLFHFDEEGNEWSINHSLGPIGPVLTILENGRKPLSVEIEAHPVARAVAYLGDDYDFDTPEYRYVCKWMGMDPDRGREFEPDSQRREKARLIGIWRNKNASDEERELAVRKYIMRTNLKNDSLDLLSQVIQDCDLFCDDDEVDDVRSIAKKIVYESKMQHSSSGLIEYFASKYSYEGMTSVFIGKDMIDNEIRISWPVVIRKPDEFDFTRTIASKILEQMNMCLVLSDEEFERYQDGGDWAHWFAKNDWNADVDHEIEDATKRSDLTMTKQIVHLLLLNSYRAHIARCEGRTVDLNKPFSCDEREPIEQSGQMALLPPLTRFGRLKKAFDRARYVRRMNKINNELFRKNEVSTRYGNLKVYKYPGWDGRLVFRPCIDPLQMGDEIVYPSFTLEWHSFAEARFPHFVGIDFSMIDAMTKRPISEEFALAILKDVMARFP